MTEGKERKTEENQRYSISELAGMFGVTPRTIRYYEEVGLLAPEERESETQQRRYSKRARARLKLILRGKRFGFSLGEIKEMIELSDVDPSEKEQLKRTLAYGDKKIAEIDEMISELTAIKEEMLEFREKFSRRLREQVGEGREDD